ncbi:MAG: glutathione S-transferase [Methylotenera sp.]|uniref:glutathione S-transferase n=1 Tax=Methylotenera sp. TaxID=2051956 RepID=UPI000D403DF7|nr:glutathione S-transferase [Methylotenera sp.]PPC80830.1 MAG: glutathione S-transferase [Methylotenera sp.]
MTLPILYSYRRCPYAMRARMALMYAGIAVEIREIALRDKPVHLLAVSPKGTVPVLITVQGDVLEQSLDIMHWALRQSDPDGWLSADDALTQQLITENDTSFKQTLDRYKYAIRFPEQPMETYRAHGEVFLAKLEHNLAQTEFLMGDKLTLADIAIFPFIRQFSAVDSVWFESADYTSLKAWLNLMLSSALFNSVMDKHPVYLG